MSQNLNTQIASLKDELGNKRAQQRALISTAEAEKRDFNDDENTQFTAIDAEIRSLQTRIDRLAQLEAVEKNNANNQRQNDSAQQTDAEERQVADAVNIYMRRGLEGLTAEQRSMLESRALSSVTGSAGAYTIPQGFANVLEVAMMTYGGILSAATIMDTDTGNDIPHPTMNDNSNTGAILGENTTVGASTDPSFGVVTLKAYTYSSKPILVPNQLLEDSAFNLDAYLANALAERIGRAFNTHGTTGTGTDQPQGIVTASTKGADAAAGAITYDNLVDLQHSVDPAYRKNGAWMMNDSTFKALRKLKDTTGQPIFQLSMRDGEPTTLLGKPVIINNDMAAIGASAKSVLFGDFSKYKVRRVKNYGVKRLTERYADLNQTAFLLFVRLDGKLIDAGTHPVKHLLHAAS
ncbi:MAG: phage major capsid protein [Marinilabiliaceae bacterium]|nr:phage major capsid protein [Marinilabiliaceae bacterium]